MKTSDSIVKIMPALVKAQSEIGSAKKGANNPFFQKKYADLPAVIEVCKEPLNKNGIVLLQPVIGDSVETILLHESGEWISDEGVRILSKEANNPQAQGSAITYARRYGLMSILSIPAEDDDAEGAMNRKNQDSSSSDKEVINLGKINLPFGRQNSDDDETKWCSIHEVSLSKGISKKTNKPYWYHRLNDENRTVCFGKE